MDEIPLMEVVYVLQEELHIAGLFGQNQAALLFCYRVTTHKFLESAVSNRIALNIAQSKRHARPRLRAQRCNCAAETEYTNAGCLFLTRRTGRRSDHVSASWNLF